MRGQGNFAAGPVQAGLDIWGDGQMVVHAIRQPSGLAFVVRCDTPIPRGAPEAMMQAVNDNLEALVRAHMDQWFWVHRRWKTPKTARRDAAPIP